MAVLHQQKTKPLGAARANPADPEGKEGLVALVLPRKPREDVDILRRKAGQQRLPVCLGAEDGNPVPRFWGTTHILQAQE